MINLFEIYSDEHDVKAVTEVIKRGKSWADGPENKIFEEKIAQYVGRKYAAVFNSGTSALHSNLLANNIKRGDEVIVPSFTFISTANTVLLAGAKPIFADIEKKSYGLDPEDVEKKITPKTKAIIPVHYGGAPCIEIEKLQKIAKKYQIQLIEDAAEGLGSKINNQMVGTHGDSAMFSFCQNKIITCGEGGAITTDSQETIDQLHLFRSHGREEKGTSYFNSTKPLDYIKLGYNYRLPTICAALGISQLEKIEDLIKKRQAIAKEFDLRLKECRQVKTPYKSNHVNHIYQMYTIEVPVKEREKLQQKLLDQGIMTKIYFPPIHLEKLYKNKYKYSENMLPVTEEISKKVLTLPMHPKIKLEEIEYISKSIIEYFR